MMKKYLFLLITISILAGSSLLTAQNRVCVLPFQNKDGKIELNIWCYNLQDSVYKALKAADPEGKLFQLIPADSIEALLTEMNLDPTNPQYPSDMWKAVKMLNCQKVITGNFNIQAGKFLINAYVYNSRTKLAYPKHQARDIFKSPEEVYESIGIITESLLPHFRGE
ncbi:MAG: hypothetical protein QG635_1825 [Bacteroidota bacterium]|nr:hypothetical protein [Bacteroidota bacterium]